MIITFFILLVIGLSFELRDDKYKNQIFKILLAFIIIFEAIKLDSATDYWNYYNHYITISELIAKSPHRFEPGYSLLVLFFKYLNFSFWQFLFFFYGIVYSLYYFSLKKVTKFPITAFFMIIGLTIGYLGSNRQLMAVAIIFASTVFFYKNPLIWSLYIILASMFHYSAIFTLPLMLLNREFKPVIILSGFVICLITVISGLNYNIIIWLSKIIYLKDNYEVYLTQVTVRVGVFSWMTGMFAILRRVAPIVLLSVFSKQLKAQKLYYLIFNIHILSLLLFIFSITNIDAINARLSLYLLIFEAITYSWCLAHLFEGKNKYRYYMAAIFVLFVVAISIKAISHYPHLFYPYNTIFGKF